MVFSRPSRRSQRLVDTDSLPPSFVRFIFDASVWHQLAVSVISVAVFLLNTAPIETQRRIIESAVNGGSVAAILTLVAAQCAIVIAFGLTKLAMNVYRAWIGECATRALRLIVEARLAKAGRAQNHASDGAGLAMIIAEADDVGAFVGSSISVPVVEAGFLITVFAYLAALDTRMMLLSLVVFTPQFVFVPLIQRAINRRVARRTRTLRLFGGDMLSADQSAGDGATVDRLGEVFVLDMGIYRLKFSLNFLMNFTYSLSNILVLGVGGLLVVRGEAEIATVITFLSAIGKVVDPWNDVVDWARSFAMAAIKYELIVQGAATLRDGGAGVAAPSHTRVADPTVDDLHDPAASPGKVHVVSDDQKGRA